MKKIIILSALALIASVSCTKTISESEYSGSFSIEAGFPETKAYMGEAESSARKVLWKTGDQICVNGLVSNPLDAQYDGCPAAKFTFAQTPSAPYKMVYPVAAFSADSVIVPAVQSFVNKQFDPAAAIFVGTSSESLVSLKNACGYVQVTVAKAESEELSAIQLTAHQPLCGKFAVDFANAKLAGGADTANVITVTTPEGIAYDTDNKVCAVFVVPAGTYAAGFSAVIKTKDGKKMVKNAYATTGITVEAGKIITMPQLTFAEGGVFSGGLGTEANPYKIANVEDLKEIATYVNSETGTFASAVYSQIADIEDAAVADHIGSTSSESKYFKGTYHGNGHKITNVSFSAPTNEKGHGLFGEVYGGRIDYLTIDGYSQSGITQDRQGVFVGLLDGGGVVDHCNLVGKTVTLVSSQAGAIVGRSNSVVTNCSVTADLIFAKAGCGAISGLTSKAGGAVNCTVKCNIKVDTNVLKIGGIIGISESQLAVEVENCTYSGTISSLGGNVGGIIGYKGNRTSSVVGCTVDGNIISAGAAAGGIMGVAVSGCSIDKCVTTANVTALHNAGGVLGQISATSGTEVKIINTVCSGATIKATGLPNGSKYARVGGILGGSDASTKPLNLLNSCTFNIKLVSEATGTEVNGFGGLGGSVFAAGNIKGCYSAILDTDITYAADALKYKGAIVGYNKATLDATDYYDTANKHGAFYAKNACTGITTAQFTDGTLLGYMNASAAKIDGAASWVADKSGYPVPKR